MITPLLRMTESDKDSESLNQSLLSAARHWSLFGSLAISARMDQIQAIKFLIRQLGDVDIDVWIAGIDSATALELLNQGASKIVGEESNFSGLAEDLPGERLSKVISSLDPTEWSFGPLVDLLFVGVAPLDALDVQVVNDITVLNPATDQDGIDGMMKTISEGARCLIDVANLEQDPELLPNLVTQLVKSDRPDGLIPTVIVDAIGTALGLAYSNRASIAHAITTRNGTYWSRSRDELWEKGATSGATQRLLRIDTDCDRDCLRFTVDQKPPGFCHRNTYTCFGEQRSIQTVIHRLQQRINGSDTKSFTHKLANDAKMLETKLLEEAQELSDADSIDEITWEAADVLYFSLVKMVKHDVPLDRVFAELSRRMNRVVRRKNKLEE